MFGIQHVASAVSARNRPWGNIPNHQEWEMRATVDVPEPTWRLSASAGDRPAEHRQRLMLESSLTTCRAADSGLSRLD